MSEVVVIAALRGESISLIIVCGIIGYGVIHS